MEVGRPIPTSADSLLSHASQRSLSPDTSHGDESGGDPTVIPDWSFEQFVEFHERYYHPINSHIFYSGDDNVYKFLEIMDEYLNEF